MKCLKYFSIEFYNSTLDSDIYCLRAGKTLKEIFAIMNEKFQFTNLIQTIILAFLETSKRRMAVHISFFIDITELPQFKSSMKRKQYLSTVVTN